MLSRLLWVLAFLVGAVLFVKPLRERVRPEIEYAMTPLYRWEAKNRVNEIYRILQRERAQGQQIPRPREFQRFLTMREGADAALDPWGEPFYLESSRRVVRVGSAGPDRARGTDDDIHSKPEEIAPAR